MIAEALMYPLLKATLGVAGSAWAISLFEQDWFPVVVALPALALLLFSLRHHSRRLRGKRAEGPP